MKNIIKVLFATLTAGILFCGCKKEEAEVLNHSLQITLGRPVVNGTQVRIQVKHNGSDEDPWYGFYTEDLKTDEALLIGQEVERLMASGSFQVKRNKSLAVNLQGLEEYTSYKYIAFGLSEKGTYYGLHASAEFTTQNDLNAVYECDDWKITYKGRALSEDTGEMVETFQVDNPHKKRLYFTTFSTSYLTNYSIEDIVRGEIGYIKETLMGEYGMAVDDLSHKDETMLLQDQRQISGDYIALAIGLDDTGEATRYYTAQEFNIPEEEATAEYLAWLGTWNLTGGDSKQHFEIVIQPLDNNYLYAIRLWECGDHLTSNILESFGGDLPFPAYYKEGGKLVIKSESITEVTFGSDKENIYMLGLYGNLTYNGEYGGLGLAGVTLGEADAPVGNSATIQAADVTFDDGQVVTVESIQFQAYPYQGQQYMTFNTPMAFPIAMEKTEEYTEPESTSRLASCGVRNVSTEKLSIEKKLIRR